MKNSIMKKKIHVETTPSSSMVGGINSVLAISHDFYHTLGTATLGTAAIVDIIEEDEDAIHDQSSPVDYDLIITSY
jgi:hypothetical protein